MRRIYKKNKSLLVVLGIIVILLFFVYSTEQGLFFIDETNEKEIEYPQDIFDEERYTNEEIDDLIRDYVTEHSSVGGGPTYNYNFEFDNVVTIAKGGQCDYNTIQTALDENPTANTLFLVFPGVYTDTIHFTANFQTVISASHAQNTKVRQIDENVVNASDYNGCLIKYLHIQLWEPDSDVDMITVGDGFLSVLSTKLTLNTTQTIAGVNQPHVVNVYGNGLYKSKLGEIQYFHSGNTVNGIKAPFDVTGADGMLQILRLCKLNITNSGTATATTIYVSDGSGKLEINYLSDADVTDTDAAIVAGFGYIGSSENSTITHSTLTVTGGGSNNCYAAYHTGTGLLRSAHNNIMIQSGANNYGIYLGASGSFAGHMDDVRASDGDQIAGTVYVASSQADGNFTISGNLTTGNLILPTTAPTNPVSGSIWLNATTNEIGTYNGSVWKWR